MASTITTRWRAKLVFRRALEAAAKSDHIAAQRALTDARANQKHPRDYLVALRDAASAKLTQRRKQVAEAERVLARHADDTHLSSPVEPILGDTWGWHPGIHDGVDLIAHYDDEVVAICDGIIVDSRPSGWWGKGAAPSSGHPVSDGDGIIQLRSTADQGPFKPGLVFGYGHTEHSTVKVGQKVKAGQTIGRIGWAKAAHIHFMVNAGNKRRSDGGYSGIGDRDPLPYVNYARSHA